MPRLSRMRFVSVGYKDARFHDLIIDFRDDYKRATDTIVWLRNGGGKTSILNLTFSVLRPDQREFLGRKQEGKPRKLADYVLTGDVAVVVLEWEDDSTSQTRLDGASAPHYITGQLLERKGSSADDASLKRLFFASREASDVGGLTLETLPLWVRNEDGTEAHATINGFREAWGELRAKYPEHELQLEDNQTTWNDILETARLDPEIFAYQIRMNLKEGAADDLFRFQTHEEFIDFLLAIALPLKLGERAIKNIGTFQRELKNRKKEWEPEKRLGEGLKERLLPLLGIADERHELGSTLRTISDDLGVLETHLAKAHAKLAEDIESLSKKADGATRKHRDAKEEHQSALKRAAELARHAAIVRVREAELEAAAKETDERAALKHKRLWNGTVPLRRARLHELQRKGYLEDLARRQSENSGLVEELANAAADYKFTIEDHLQELQREIADATQKNKDAEKERKTLLAEFNTIERQDSEAETNRKHVDEALARSRKERARLAKVGHLGIEESVAAALDRLKAAATEANGVVHASRNLIEGNTQFAEHLDRRARDEDAKRSQASSDHRLVQEALKRHAAAKKAIEANPHIQQVLQTEHVEIDVAADAATHLLTTGHRSALETILRTRLAKAEHERALGHLENGGLLPPTRDVEQLLQSLRAKFDGVWSGWEYLAENAGRSERASELVRQAPLFALGIVVRDTDHDVALSLVDSLPKPEFPIALFTQSQFKDLGTTRAQVLPPRSAALYDKNAGADELRARRERAEQTKEDEKSSAQRELDLRGALSDIQRYTKEYPAGWAHARKLELDAAWERVTGAQDAASALRDARQAKIEENVAAAKKIEKARQTLADIQLASAEINAFHRDHGSQEQARQATLAEILERRQGFRERKSTITTQLQDIDDGTQERTRTLTEQSVTLQLQKDKLANIRWYELAKRLGAKRPVDEIRQAYERLLSAYEKNVNEQGLLKLAKEQQELAAEEHRRVAQHAKDGATEKDITLVLDGMEDPSRVEDASEAANERYRAASSAHATAKSNITTFKEAIKAAENRCREVKSAPSLLGTDPPATYAEANVAAIQVADRAAAMAEELPNLEEAARLAGEAHRTAAQRASHIERDFEAVQGVGRAFSDILLTPGPRPIPEGWNAPEEKSVRALSQDAEKKLVELRETDKQLNARREKQVEVVRRFAGQNEFKDLPSGIATNFMSLGETDLENSARGLSEQLESRIAALTARISEFEINRQIIIDYAMAAVEEALDIMKRAANNSRMPDTIRTFGGHQFLKLSWDLPEQLEERRGRLGDLVDEISSASELPSATEFVQRAVRKVIKSPKVHVLFPDPDAPVEYLEIPQTAVKSGGERLTLAVVLFCLLARLRGRTMTNRSSTPFLLDNPVGTANLVRFVQLQRDVAKATNVQLIYTTGLNDLEALRIFPRIARLRNARRSRRTGHRHIEADPTPLIDAAHVGFGAIDEEPE